MQILVLSCLVLLKINYEMLLHTFTHSHCILHKYYLRSSIITAGIFVWQNEMIYRFASFSVTHDSRGAFDDMYEAANKIGVALSGYVGNIPDKGKD